MSYRVQHRIGVAAPASAVWSTVSELESWAVWNPLYVEAEGRLSIGSLLQLKRKLGERSERLEVRVVDWVPNEQIVWKREIGLFATSLGYIEIEALSERACIVSAGEMFEGRLGVWSGKRSRSALMAGFIALCEAAKAQAEAGWDGTPDEPPPPPPPQPKRTKGPAQMQMSMRGMKKQK